MEASASRVNASLQPRSTFGRGLAIQLGFGKANRGEGDVMCLAALAGGCARGRPTHEEACACHVLPATA